MLDLLKRHLRRPAVVELLPAAVFFVVNFGWDLRAATFAVMAATLAAVLIGYLTERRIPLIAVSTLVIVLALGATSLLLDDERFVKIKPTVGKMLFAAILAVGLAFRPSFLERMLDGQLRLTAGGWRALTFCWIAFALFLAGLNEAIWRSFDTDTWVSLKTALLPVSIVGYVAITRAVAPLWWDREAGATEATAENPASEP